MKYRITRLYYKEVEVEADDPDDAREIVNLNYLFDDAKLIASNIDKVEEIDE